MLCLLKLFKIITIWLILNVSFFVFCIPFCPYTGDDVTILSMKKEVKI